MTYDYATPLDAVTEVAEACAWHYKREENTVSLTIPGSCANYESIIVWDEATESLHIAVAFNFSVPSRYHFSLFKMINDVNTLTFNSAFVFCTEIRMIVLRSKMFVTADQLDPAEKIEDLLYEHIESCDTFYPSFQQVGAGVRCEDARQYAFRTIYGHA